MSIIQESQISAVIDGHPLLENYLDIDKQRFATGGHIWQAVLTTQGTFNAQVHHRADGSQLKD